ncbi:MAG: 2,3-bisphosphoglycerate-dependent phosphoglycerate mutase [Pseudonocardiales bacterium]|jgi:broad specificity phosphatase PhoE|nr:2,3-bisphosphoglycerate-dependent phosphoglycerate mutase [Pseudonocardiales bacterium]
MAVTELILVRHGESIGNVAREEAESAGALSIAMPMRDADVPLSELGARQARAVGRWLAEEPGRLPDAVWSSPYLRARQTAQTALAELVNPPAIRQDERIRDRELGVLDLLTTRGVTTQFAAEAQRRRWLGKFYYRPPGGESWADLVLRIRAFLADLERGPGHGRQLIVSHDAVIILFRYVCEQLDEDRVFEIARSGSVINGSVSRLVRHDGEPGWRAAAYNDHQHLEAFGAPATEHPGEIDVAR